MVLKVLIDENSTKDVGTYYFPKKGPGLSDKYKLEEYLSESPFSYLKQETIKFIYKDICDEDVEQMLDGKKPKEKVEVDDLLPKDGILYLQQGEMGITHPQDEHIKYIGSSDATTCHLLLLRDNLTGVSGVAHIDEVNSSHLNNFISKVRKLANERINGQENQSNDNSTEQTHKCDRSNTNDTRPLELYVVGGYQDERGMSERLSIELLTYLIESPEIFLLKILAIGSLNTTRMNQTYNAPILYGAAIEMVSGRVFPAGFAYRGPDETIRHLRLSFCGRKNGFVEPYNHETGELIVQAFSVNAHTENLAYYMRLSDDTFLQCMSTSPKVEPLYFVENQKKIFRTAIENPDLYKDIFPGRSSRVWKFHKDKGWTVVDNGKSPCKIIDQDDIKFFQK